MQPIDLNLPYPAWNPAQWETITQLVCSDKKYILLEAPTGVGKSGIIVGTANLLEYRLLVATATKQLQDQYRETLDLYDVRGRGNFPCAIEPVTADVARCTVGEVCHVKTITRHMFHPPDPHEGCDPCDRAKPRDICAYYHQRYQAESEPQVVLNYAYYLTMTNYAGAFRGRDMVVFDEAHILEDELRRFATIGFSAGIVHRLGLPINWSPVDDVRAWQAWAMACRVALAKEYFQISKNTAGPSTSPDEDRRRRDILTFVRQADQFGKLDSSGWVGEKNDKTGYAEFKPIWIGPLAHDLLYRHLEGTQKVIMMSGTILDRELFSLQLGLDPDEVDFIQMPSTFAAERRPLIYDPMPKGSYKDPEYITELGNHVDSLIDLHPGESGIIHTVSHALAQAIIRGSKHRGSMVIHDKDDKAVRLDLFRRQVQSGKRAIWISPSSAMGIDLPYDLCRWQIIAKIPFPNLGDKQVKQIMQVLPDGRPAPKATRWYNWTALCTLMQAYGRGMRAPDDQCTTYLIDPNWRWFRQATRLLQPAWFRQALRKAMPRPVVDKASASVDSLFARLYK